MLEQCREILGTLSGWRRRENLLEDPSGIGAKSHGEPDQRLSWDSQMLRGVAREGVCGELDLTWAI